MQKNVCILLLWDHPSRKSACYPSLCTPPLFTGKLASGSSSHCFQLRSVLSFFRNPALLLWLLSLFLSSSRVLADMCVLCVPAGSFFSIDVVCLANVSVCHLLGYCCRSLVFSLGQCVGLWILHNGVKWMEIWKIMLIRLMHSIQLHSVPQTSNCTSTKHQPTSRPLQQQPKKLVTNRNISKTHHIDWKKRTSGDTQNSHDCQRSSDHATDAMHHMTAEQLSASSKLHQHQAPANLDQRQ